MKALGLVVLYKRNYNNCILKTCFCPCDPLMQPAETVKTTSVGDHPGIIPVKFLQNPMRRLWEENVSKIVDARTDAKTHERWTTDTEPSQKLDLIILSSGGLKYISVITNNDIDLDPTAFTSDSKLCLFHAIFLYTVSDRQIATRSPLPQSNYHDFVETPL